MATELYSLRGPDILPARPMTDEEKYYDNLVSDCLNTPAGNDRILFAHSQVLAAWLAGKFNTERAVEIFRMMIERAIIDSLDREGARLVIGPLKRLRITENRAWMLTNAFKKHFGAEDQRPVRRGLSALIFGR